MTDLHGPYRNLEHDVREGLGSRPRSLPPKYFYDETGSALFEKITTLPEYYQTRTEEVLLSDIATDLTDRIKARSIVELGSGSSTKTRVLLDAFLRAGTLETYVPVDVSPSMLEETAASLDREYPGLEVVGLVHDFEAHLDLLPGAGPHLLLFLGGTIGNLDTDAKRSFLRDVADVLDPQDCFLLGTDLVKDRAALDAAYNDSQGITARFNLNVLEVLNRELGANFDTTQFAHRAFFNEEESRIEMHLIASSPQRVTFPTLDMLVEFEAGEGILTEISCKFTEESVREMLVEVGLEMAAWYTDEENLFGLSLSRPAVPPFAW